MLRDQRVGILGVGRMGLPIARRLHSAGFAVTVYDVRPERAASAGTAVAGSATALAARSDILITVLPGIAEIEEAMLGAGSLVDDLPTGSMWLDLTSNDPRIATLIADRARSRGILSLGAPMAGGVAGAAGGGLRFYVGGDLAALERVRDLLTVLGSVEHAGRAIGDGYTVKLLSNLLWFGQVVAVTEALLLGKSLGLSPSALRQQLADGAGGSVFVDEYLDRLLDGDYLGTFGIDRCVEELETLASLARAAAVPFELGATVARLHREALERFGAIDGELLAARLLEERAHTTLRVDRSDS